MKKNIVLIGGSQGIGREIVELLQGSCSLYALSPTGSWLKALNVPHIPFDLRDELKDLSGLPATIDGLVLSWEYNVKTI